MSLCTQLEHTAWTPFIDLRASSPAVISSQLMTADGYLESLLARYAVNVAGAKAAAQIIYPVLQTWGNQYLVAAEFSGSLAKGTGVSVSTDADVLLSLSSVTPGTLADIYESLWKAIAAAGYSARRQNVSIGLSVLGYAIDLVPARRQSQWGDDHSLYRSKQQTWTKTNVNTHINFVTGSGRTEEIRILKIWRERHQLEFPSFFLEMSTIDALQYARVGNLANNVLQVLDHLRDRVQIARYIDPANTSNVISNDCTAAEKQRISQVAAASLLLRRWEDIVW
jgi:hypothetical protein